MKKNCASIWLFTKMISGLRICALHYRAVFCSSVMSCCLDKLLRYYVNDCEIVPVFLLLLVPHLFLHSMHTVFILWGFYGLKSLWRHS